MKLKKLLISASAIAAGSGLLATVLTGCAKASIDDKLKISLDDNGLLYNPGKMGDAYKIDYKKAIEYALTRSNTWGQFKNAVADEIIYQWYLDRAATDKDSDKKNTTFRSNIDEWNYQINKDYDSTIQTCKDKYGSNWGFYLQNEYLAPLGGSEESYKHAKLVEKVKAEFVSKVFAKSYFGYQTQTSTKAPEQYKHIFIKASKDVDKNTLRNPENWDKIGFFARADLSFPVSDKDVPESYDNIDASFLAKHPEGDYAAIQDYVFNRWFVTEKPFFAVASLFKYSAPKYVAGGKLDQIYNATYTGVKLPDKPNEAFPFFGAGDDGSTRKFVDFLADMEDSKFATKYIDNDGDEQPSNGTITIPVADTDDSQTLLLVCGNQMFTSLYTPYAMTMGNLYAQMMGSQDEESNPNHLEASLVKANVRSWKSGSEDDFAILKNFFYTADPSTSGVTKTLDLNTVYGGLNGEEYHCPLFLECKSYPYFYGDTTQSTAAEKSGIRYITNNIQVDDFLFSSEEEEQPWVMELNEAGVHVQTIDGFASVAAKTTETAKLAQLKNLVKYRLMQKQTNDEAAPCISTDLLGESGKLKTYFNDNFADIVIELATQKLFTGITDTVGKYNVFRKIDSYKVATSTDDNLLLYGIMNDQKLCSTYNNIVTYLDALIGYETAKKNFANLETANNKIYSYRSKQISNSKTKSDFAKTIFENGLLAPFVYAPESTEEILTTRDYSTVNRVVVQGFEDLITTGYIDAMKAKQKTVSESAFVTEVLANAQINGETGFAPQIASAKSASCNRFWYKSGIVDKIMYSIMGNKAVTANAIKKNTYDFYTETMKGSEWFGSDLTSGKIWGQDCARNAFNTTYARSKLLTGDKNISAYAESPDDIADVEDFYSLMNDSFFNWYMPKDENENGAFSDNQLNYSLLKATVMYLTGSDKTGEDAKLFDNFYTLINAKVNEDEAALVGYLSKDYADTTKSRYLEDLYKPIEYMQSSLTTSYAYDYKGLVDNEFDKNGYSGKADSREYYDALSVANQWTVVEKTINGITRDFSGFLGIQTKASNQLDSGSGMQAAVFDNFAKATYNSYNLNESTLATPAQYEQNHGCWFKFAGQLNSDLTPITFSFEHEGTKVTADDWFPITTNPDTNYGVVRKIAQKIVNYRTPDDLRSLASTLASCYDGYSEFSGIAQGTISFSDTDSMKLAMLQLLPHNGASEASHKLNTFQRVSNAEAHTIAINPVYAFKDSKAKTAHKLLLTQINKADITEHRLAPTWNETDKKWEQGDSPITPEEFWVILFNLASESTVQTRVITEAVKNAYGDDKLIVYDAQLYNQFDSVWIKDWSKKTMGA